MKKKPGIHIVISILSIFLLLILIGCETGIGKKPGQAEFESLYKDYQALLSYSGPAYQDISKKNAELQDKSRLYLKNFPASDNRPEVERILSEVKDMQLKLQQEQFDCSELEKGFKNNHTMQEADLEINNIKRFLRNNPRSVKADDLKKRIEELTFKKFQLEAVKLQTISEVNQTVQKAKTYLGQLTDANFKARVNDKIKKVEAQRQSIYEMEFQYKAAELFKEMDARVEKIAKEAHPASKIESASASILSGNVSKAAPQVKIVREYVINMRGAFIGINRYQLKIQVSGLILGTNQTGVTYNLSGAIKVSDFKI